MGEIIQREVDQSDPTHQGNWLLSNPVFIWVLTCFFMYTLGDVIISSFVEGYFLGGPGILGSIFDKQGLCGSFESAEQWHIIPCRLFFPPPVIFIGYVPMFVISALVWVVLCLVNRRLLLQVTRQQRWVLILVMSSFLLLLLILSARKFAEYALFAGPIHGFHPFLPILTSFCNFIVPLVVWVIIDQVTKPHREIKNG